MTGIEKITEYIKTASEAECEEITRNSIEECERIRTEYSRSEQDEYWRSINNGSKETEQRLSSLGNLASAEANKQIAALQEEMLDQAFALAAKKLLELPGSEYAELRKKFGADPDINAEALVESYRDELSQSVISELFE